VIPEKEHPIKNLIRRQIKWQRKTWTKAFLVRDFRVFIHYWC